MGDGFKLFLSVAVFVGMIVLCAALFQYGGAGGLIGCGLGFVMRLGGRGLDASERLGNAYVGALMGLPMGLLAGALYTYVWPQIAPLLATA